MLFMLMSLYWLLRVTGYDVGRDGEASDRMNCGKKGQRKELHERKSGGSMTLGKKQREPDGPRGCGSRNKTMGRGEKDQQSVAMTRGC